MNTNSEIKPNQYEFTTKLLSFYKLITTKNQTEKILKLEKILNYQCKLTKDKNIYRPKGTALVGEENIKKFQKEFIHYHKVLDVEKYFDKTKGRPKINRNINYL